MNPPRLGTVCGCRGQGDGKREPEHASLARPRCLPDHRVRPAQQPRGGVEVPRRRSPPDLGAADGAPVHLERRHDDDVEAATGRPAPRAPRASPPAGSRTRRRASSGSRPGGVRAAIRSTNASYGVSRRAGRSGRRPSCRRRRPRAASSRSSGIAQDRRGAAGEHLVRVVVERDDDRARAARRAASATRCSRRYAWPRWRPSNTPTTTKAGSRRRARSRRGPRRRAFRRPRPPARRALLGGRRVAEVRLRRARRAPCAGAARRRPPRHTAATAPVRTDRERRSGRRGSASGVLGAVISPSPSRRISSSVIVACGQVLQAGVDRPQDALRCPRVRRPRGRAASSSAIASSSRNAARGGPHQRPEVRARAQLRPEVPRERADVRPGRAGDVDDRDRPRRVGVVPLDQVAARGSSRRAPASSTGSPERASWYARRPATWTAL